MKESRIISKPLAAYRVRCAFGITAQYLLRILAFGIPLLCLYGLADMWLALPETSRRFWNLLLPVSLALGALAGLGRPGSLRALALRLDQWRGDRRRTFTCALDLEHEAPQSPLHRELRDAALAESRDALRTVPLRATVPFARLGLLAALLATGLLALISLRRAYPDVVETVSARLLRPGADIAPWTPLRFAVGPDAPTVEYGGDLPVTLDLSGGDIQHPVYLLTRMGDRVRRVQAFREGPHRYSQRLEQVTEPMEFAFEVGRARSAWFPVEVALLPRVVETEVELTPPAYSRRPSRRFAFGERVIEGLPGTRIEVAVTSNRPLSQGVATLERHDHPTRLIKARVEGHTARFSWTLDHNASIEIDLKDLVGNAMARPLAGHQRDVPDREPDVVLHDPPRFMLATPNVTIPVHGGADDDVGVTRLHLVRGMPGYIDRPAEVAGPLPERRKEVRETLDLAALGVEPGQTLELYLEARDHRPDGQWRAGVSDLARIRIISEEEYAAMVRQREGMDAFQKRFQVVAAAMRDVDESLKNLREEVDREDATRDTLRQAKDRAAASARRAEEAFTALAQDFPLFEVEDEARDELAKLRDHFSELGDELEALDVDDMAFDIEVARLTGAHREQADSFEQTRREQERFLLLGRLLEQTAEYRELLRRQELLTRWFERHTYDLPAESREEMERLARYQEALRQEMEAWMKETRTRARDLDPQDQAWADQVLEMLRQLEDDQALQAMDRAVRGARNEDNRGATRAAKTALDALRGPENERDPSPESSENTFEQMCRGQGPSAPGQGDALSRSLRQLMDALNSRGGEPGQGGTTGGGIGGFSDDGFAAPGSSPLHLPMRGPNRHAYDQPYGQNVEGTSGSGREGSETAADIARGDSGGAPPASSTPGERILEQAPPRYREAIRRFYDLQPENTP